MNRNEYKTHNDGRLYRKSNLPDVESRKWVYPLGKYRYLSVMEMTNGDWSIMRTVDHGFQGEDTEQLASGLNAQEAQRRALLEWM